LSECPWDGCLLDDEFLQSCNTDDETEMPSEPAQAMDVEPSMTHAVPQTPPKNHAVLPPPSKRPKKAAGTSMEYITLPTPKVSAKKVKDGQTKLKRKFKKRHRTKTFQLDINDKGCWVSKTGFTIRFDGALLTPTTGRSTDVLLHLFHGMFPVVDLSL